MNVKHLTLATLATVSLSASPALADDSNQLAGSVTAHCTAAFTTIGDDLSERRATVVASAQASSSARNPVVSTSVNCFVRATGSAAGATVPGPAAAATGVLTYPAAEPLELCVTGSANFLDGSVLETPVRCAPA